MTKWFSPSAPAALPTKAMKAVFSLFLLAPLTLAATNTALAADIRMSSTIGPIDAGIVPLLAKAYQQKTGTAVVYEGAGTGATLEKAKTGKFDLVMVHARRLEDQFIADGYGVKRLDVMYNDFVILGPASDPAKIRGMSKAAEALRSIADKKALFVTRGDNSGTHVKEMDVWRAAKITPEGTWYTVFPDGAKGNKATVTFADQKQAYTLMDRATYLTMKKDTTLVPLVERDDILLNLIAVIAVNPQKFPDLHVKETQAFIDWLTGIEAQTLIKNFGVDLYGEPLFFPNSAQWHAANPR